MIKPEVRAKLLTALRHGDQAHQSWLKNAIDAVANGTTVPEPYGRGSKEILEERNRLLYNVVKATDLVYKAILEAQAKGKEPPKDVWEDAYLEYLHARKELREKEQF